MRRFGTGAPSSSKTRRWVGVGVARRSNSIPGSVATTRILLRVKVPRCSRSSGYAAQVIIAEIGLDMTQFPTPAHLVSWAKLSPRTIQSGPRTRAGGTGKGNPYLKGILGEVASAAARTDTFFGGRYRRLVRRRGRQRALVAIARSILVAVWHLLDDPNLRFVDLGADFYERRINKDRRTHDLIRQLNALGHQVSLSPAA